MAQRYGPRIVTDSLVLCLDAHDAKSYAGEVTTNLLGSNDNPLNGMSGISLTKIETQADGWIKYSMSGTFTGGTYPYMSYIDPVSFTGGTAYTSRAMIKTNVESKFNYFGSNGINYVNQPKDAEGTSRSVATEENGFNVYTVSREGFIYTSTTSQTGYLFTNPINNTTFSSSTDFMWIKNVQVEQKTYPTPYTYTSRSGTNGILDRSGNGNHGTLYNTIGTKASHYRDGQVIMPVANSYIDLNGTTSTQELITLGAASKYFSPDFAWEIWFKSAGLGTGMSLGGLIYIDYGLGMYINGSGNLTVNAYDYAGGYPGTAVLASTFTMSPSLFNNEWRHVIVTLGASTDGTYEVYVDGVKTHNGTVPTGWNGNSYWGTLTARIGNNPNNVYYNLKGQVALARIYHKHLTEAEAISNYNATKGRFS